MTPLPSTSPVRHSVVGATCRPCRIFLRKCSPGCSAPLELEVSVETVGLPPSNPTVFRDLGGLPRSLSSLTIQECPYG